MDRGKGLADRIETLRSRLETARYVLTEQDRLSYLSQLEALTQKLLEARQSLLLHVGLLGGTGVGKSTLINALAGDTISSVSDRRPHTDKIVAYRHERVSLPEALPRHLLNQPEKTHDIDLIRHLVLYDLPDFDSIRTDHFDRVDAFLAHLDLIVWVTSPEKYADLKFYELLGRCGKHQDNFLFVLNKADRLASPGGDMPSEAASLLGDFTLKLKASGIRAPRIYLFSALEVTNEHAPAWLREDFQRFSEVLFKRKEQKEILAIKASNVEVEFEALKSRLCAGRARLDRFQQELEGFLQALARAVPSSKDRLRQGIDRFFTAATALHLRRKILEARKETWPVHLLRGLWERLGQGSIPPGTPSGWESSISTEDPRLQSLRDELAISLDPLVISLHRFGLSHVAGEAEQIEKEANQDIDRLPAAGCERFAALPISRSTFWEKTKDHLRRSWQRFLLAVPAFFLFVALAGPEQVEALVRDPEPFRAVRVFLLAAIGLFQPGGLASIAAFGLAEFLIALALASRAIRKAEAKVNTFRRTLQEDLTGTLVEQWQKRMESARELCSSILRDVRTFSQEGEET
jgi:GTPase SAR1 family protein